MDLTCWKELVLAFVLSCTRAQDCSPSYSFDVGPFSYHVIVDCGETSSRAASMCQEWNGTLALLRSEEVVQSIIDFVFENDIPATIETATTADPLSDIVGSEEIILCTTTTTTSTTATITTTAPPAPHQQSEGEDSSSSDDDSGSSSSDSSGSKRRRKRAVNSICVDPATGTQGSTTTNAPTVNQIPIYSFLAAPFVVYSDGSSQETNCAFIEFWKNPLNSKIEFRLNITNKCNATWPSFRWICETMSENYEPDRPVVVQRARVKQTVMDYRPSAIVVGSSGIAMVVSIFMLVLILDVSKLINTLRHLFSQRNASLTAFEKGRHYTSSPTPSMLSRSPTSISFDLNNEQTMEDFKMIPKKPRRGPHKIFSSD